MRRSVKTAGELCEYIQDFCDDPDVQIRVSLDGNPFEIEYVELDDCDPELDPVIHIRLKI